MRNHLVAQYFPELDTYCNWGAKEGLAIVKACLDPAVISALQHDEFLRKIQTRVVTLAQQRRLSTVWQRAFKSIGCEFGLSVEYEAQMMVKMLGQIHMSIADTQ